MAGYPGPSTDLPHGWRRHLWASLCCGWFVIGALALGVSRLWTAYQP